MQMGLGISIPEAGARNRVGAPSLPTPSNNQLVIFGDSRTQGATGDFPDTKTIGASGFLSWTLHTSGYKVRASINGNRGIGGDTTALMVARLSDVTSNPASIVVLLGGVNNGGTDAIADYTTMLNALAAAGKVVLLCNELPDNNTFNQANQLARKAWLENPARRVTWPNVVQVDTFTPMWNAATLCDFKTGYAPDGLHPAVLGNSVLGATLGAAIAAILPSQGSYLNLPSSAGDVYNASTNPGGCILPGFMMTGSGGTATGVNAINPIPTNWSFSVSNSGGATIDVTRGFDVDGFDQLIIHIYGTPTAGSRTVALQNFQNNSTYLNYLAAGDLVYSAARVKVDTGAIGFRGFGIGTTVNGNNGSAQNKTCTNFAGTSSEWPVDLAFDAPACSQFVPVHADWATMSARSLSSICSVTYTGGAPVDLTVRVSRDAMRRLI